MEKDNMKKNRKIIYYAHYARPREKACYDNSSPAACAMIEYLSETIENCDERLEILSAAITYSESSLKYKTQKLRNKTTIHYSPVVLQKNRFMQKLSIILQLCFHFFWLMFNLKKGDILLVYHSREIEDLVSIIKCLKKNKLILQVAEIYSDVDHNLKSKNKELKYFKKADALILQTKELDAIINKNHCPSVVVNGIYKPQINLVESNKKDFQMIHCVYAGTLNSEKHGAQNAILSSKHLPNNYHIHIVGFGTKDEILEVNKLIESCSNVDNATITYDGCLNGESFFRFLGKCDIGLSTQDPNGDFNATSFPSKILTYLCCGLRVVCVRIPVVENSDISHLINFYEGNTPENIAKVISNVNFESQYNVMDKIGDLNIEFFNKMKEMLREI